MAKHRPAPNRCFLLERLRRTERGVGRSSHGDVHVIPCCAWVPPPTLPITEHPLCMPPPRPHLHTVGTAEMCTDSHPPDLGSGGSCSTGGEQEEPLRGRGIGHRGSTDFSLGLDSSWVPMSWESGSNRSVTKRLKGMQGRFVFLKLCREALYPHYTETFALLKLWPCFSKTSCDTRNTGAGNNNHFGNPG